MMKIRPTILPLASLCLSLTVLAACADAPPPKLYLLTPLAAADARPTRTGGIGAPVIGVEPVSLPEYLDRPEIVTRDGANRLAVSPSDRWAERLSANVTRVLATNLSTLLKTDTVVALPSRQEREVTWRVTVDVSAFERDNAGRSVLSARWSIFDAESRTEVARRQAVYVEPAGGPGYDAMVAGMDTALAGLSRDIADDVARQQPAVRKPGIRN